MNSKGLALKETNRHEEAIAALIDNSLDRIMHVLVNNKGDILKRRRFCDEANCLL